MLRLSDVQAQPWMWRTPAGVIWMRPLSLATFAQAELLGCGMDELLGEDDTERQQAWLAFYAFLRSDPDLRAVESEIEAMPDLFLRFVEVINRSLVPEDQEAPSHHRRSKDPRGKIGTPAGSTMRSDKRGTDYTVLFDLARYAKVPVSDLYQMTFRGMIALSQHLADHPPAPSMF